MTDIALETAEILKTQGISAGVVNARFVKPLDPELLDAGTRLIVTLEDNVLPGGFGEAVATAIEERRNLTRGTTDTPRLIKIGWPDEFIGQGDTNEMLRLYGLDAASVAKRIGEAIAIDTRKKTAASAKPKPATTTNKSAAKKSPDKVK